MVSYIVGDLETLESSIFSEVFSLDISGTQTINFSTPLPSIRLSYIIKSNPSLHKIINNELYIIEEQVFSKIKPINKFKQEREKNKGTVCKTYDILGHIPITPKDFYVLENKYYFLYDDEISVMKSGSPFQLLLIKTLNFPKPTRKLSLDEKQVVAIAGEKAYTIHNDSFLKVILKCNETVHDIHDISYDAPLFLIKYQNSIEIRNRDDDQTEFELKFDVPVDDFMEVNELVLARYSRTSSTLSLYEWRDSAEPYGEIIINGGANLELRTEYNIIYLFDKANGWFLIGVFFDNSRKLYYTEAKILGALRQMDFIFHQNSIDNDLPFDGNACFEVVCADDKGIGSVFVKLSTEQRFSILFTCANEPQTIVSDLRKSGPDLNTVRKEPILMPGSILVNKDPIQDQKNVLKLPGLGNQLVPNPVMGKIINVNPKSSKNLTHLQDIKDMLQGEFIKNSIAEAIRGISFESQLAETTNSIENAFSKIFETNNPL